MARGMWYEKGVRVDAVLLWRRDDAAPVYPGDIVHIDLYRGLSGIRIFFVLLLNPTPGVGQASWVRHPGHGVGSGANMHKKESCKAGFFACGESPWRHNSIPPQCVFTLFRSVLTRRHWRPTPRGAFLPYRTHFPIRYTREYKKESCKAGFSACGGSPWRHFSFAPQCDPRGAFLSYRELFPIR